MAKKFLIRLPVLGMTSLTTDDVQIIPVIETYLSDYIVGREETDGKSHQGGTLYVFENKQLVEKMTAILKNKIQLGRGVRVENELTLNFPTRFKTIRQVATNVNGTEVSIHTFMSSAHFLFKLKSVLSNKYDFSQQLFYDYVLAPLVQAYSFVGFLPIHGATFMTHSAQEAVLVIGLDGVGKSSLSERMVQEQARVIADNIVLFNGQDVVPLLWPMRVDLNSTLVGKTTYQDKRFREIQLPVPPKIKESIPIKRIYRLSVGEFSNQQVKSLGRYFWRDLVVANLAAPEIEFMYKRLAPLFNFFVLQEAALSLDINTPCFELVIPFGQLDAGVKAVLNEK